MVLLEQILILIILYVEEINGWTAVNQYEICICMFILFHITEWDTEGK